MRPTLFHEEEIYMLRIASYVYELDTTVCLCWLLKRKLKVATLSLYSTKEFSRDVKSTIGIGIESV